MFWALFLKIVLSAAELIAFGQLRAAIWYPSTIICSVPSKITVDALKNNIYKAIDEILVIL